MRNLFRLRSPHVTGAILALAVLTLAACSSSEERAQRYYEHGKELMAAHDYVHAEVEFRNAVKYNKKLVPAWQSLAEVEELRKNWSALVPALQNLLELDPNDLATRIKLGRLMLISGGFDDALRLVNDVQEPNDQNPDLLALKAAILFKLNDTAGAVSNAQAALKADPNNTGALFVLAGNDFAHGDAQAALAILDSAPITQKNDLGASIFKLQILEKTQDLSKAEALLQKLIELYPKEASFKKELIRLYLFQHRADDAEKVQRAIIAADPNDASAQLDLVRLLNRTKGVGAAQQQLETLIGAGGDVFPYQTALAQLEFSQGKSADAVALLKKLIADNSSAEHVLTAQIDLAQIYLAQKQIDAANAIVSDILGKDARNTTGLKLRAAIRMDRGQLEGAIGDLRQALNDQPRATDLMLLLATAYERSGSIDLAENEFAEAMRVSNYDPTASLNYVAFLQRRGNVAHSEDVLIDLANRWPSNVQVLSALAQVRLARQEWAGAQEIAERLKKIGADRTTADEILGASLAGRAKYDESIVALQDAYTTSPNAVQPMYALVRAYLSANKSNDAIAFLQSVIKANPSNAEAYVLLGSVQLANKMPDQAKQSFTTAVAKQPTNVIGYRALADLYVVQKNYNEALKIIRTGLQQQPDNSVLHFALADVLERTGDFDGAIAEYQNLLAQDPGSIIVANNLASLLADHRSDKASLDQAKALVASLQKSPLPQFKDTLGWVDSRGGDYRAALPLLEAAVSAMPNAPLVRYHLGVTYAAAGQPEKASEQFKAALAQSPEPDLREKINAAQAKNGTQ